MCNPNFPGKSRYTVDDVIRMLDDSDISDLSDEEEQPFANDADGGSVESSSDDDTDTVLEDIPGDTLGEMVSVIMTREAHRELQFCHNLILKFLKSVYSDFLNVYKQHDCSSPTYQKSNKNPVSKGFEVITPIWSKLFLVLSTINHENFVKICSSFYTSAFQAKGVLLSASVHLSVRLSLCKLYLVHTTHHSDELESLNFHQTCIMGTFGWFWKWGSLTLTCKVIWAIVPQN